MSINSINIAMSGSYGAYNQKLTQETKNKLLELNIPFDSNITEAQGRALLRNAQIKQNKDSTNRGLNQNSESKSDLFKKAQELAKKLGINANEQIDFNNLLRLIEQAIAQKLQINQNNQTALLELKNLSQDLASIQAQANGSSGYDNTNQALMTSLELLSEYNKNFLKKV